MPIREYLNEPGIGPELAEAMSKAFNKVMETLKNSGVERISSQSIAQKIALLAHEGEHTAESLARAVIESLKIK